ncbi:MAG TPA: hypothetical protein EYQ21_04705 [Flavobacteriales bacterium]|nr:hypothetical protein [Flavobacteriales bacterium]
MQRTHISTKRPVFNVYHQNPLMNNNIMLAMNPEMAEDIIKLVHECCETDGGLQDRQEYPHLYSLCDRLQSRMQAMRRQTGYIDGLDENGTTEPVGVDSFLNNVDLNNGFSVNN